MFKSIRENSTLRDCHIIFCPEAAPANAAEELDAILRNTDYTRNVNLGRWSIVQEGKANHERLGCIKNKNVTEMMCLRLRFYIKAVRIRFWRHCLSGTNLPFTTPPYQDLKVARCNMLKSVLQTQLSYVSNDPDSFSDKHGEQNDLFIAFAMSAHWPDALMKSNHYITWNLQEDVSRDIVVTADTKQQFMPIQLSDDDPALKKVKTTYITDRYQL